MVKIRTALVILAAHSLVTCRGLSLFQPPRTLQRDQRQVIGKSPCGNSSATSHRHRGKHVPLALTQSSHSKPKTGEVSLDETPWTVSYDSSSGVDWYYTVATGEGKDLSHWGLLVNESCGFAATFDKETSETGPWEVGPDGSTGGIYMIKQDGGQNAQRIQQYHLVFEVAPEVCDGQYLVKGGTMYALGDVKVPCCSGAASQTPAPTWSRTAAPTGSPTPSPTELPAVAPTASPTPSPTPAPTPSPTQLPTASPTPAPTPAPTASPTLAQTPSPTASPTASPTPAPTPSPTGSPTASPTPAPTPAPTASPTQTPTPSPTESPTVAPTFSPTPSPTPAPTPSPTESPTASSTPAPTASPTPSPTVSPTVAPTASPTPSPTPAPTPSPTESPTASPTPAPTASPTQTPTPSPTVSPTVAPTASPTQTPKAEPPTASPKETSTPSPTESPTVSTRQAPPTGGTTTKDGGKECQSVGNCTIYGDPHISVFDGARISLLRQGFDQNVFRGAAQDLFDGENWLVKSKDVFIQARYQRIPGVADSRQFMRAVAVGGPFLNGSTLIVPPFDWHPTWDDSEILQNSSDFEVEGLIEASAIMDAPLVKDTSETYPGMEIKLPMSVQLTVNRFKHRIDVNIQMPPALGGQDGLCGNFNCIGDDDSLDLIENRDVRVHEGESLWPARNSGPL